MSLIEFIKYEPTPTEKHLGVASVKLYGKIILRYKIVPNKDGSSYFATPASYKMSTPPGTPDKYCEAFMLDSNFEKEEIMSLIHENVRKHMAPQASVFSPQPAAQAPAQQKPNYPYQAQQQPAYQSSQAYTQQAQQQEYQSSFLTDTNSSPF